MLFLIAEYHLCIVAENDNVIELSAMMHVRTRERGTRYTEHTCRSKMRLIPLHIAGIQNLTTRVPQ